MQGGKITYSPFYRKKNLVKVEETSLIEIEAVIKDKLNNLTDKNKKSVFLLLIDLLKLSPILIKLIYSLTRLFLMFKSDKKTSTSGLVKALIAVLAIVLNIFGIEMTDEVQTALNAILASIWVIVDFVQSLMTKDKENVDSSKVSE